MSLAIVAAVAASAALLLNSRPKPSDLDTAPVPLLGVIELTQEELREAAILEIRFERQRSLLASGADGRITAVLIEAGDELHSGTPIAQIGGVTVLTIETDKPFFRPLTSGSKGKDVTNFQCMLKEQGFYQGECDGNFGRATLVAARGFNESIGRGRLADFDPSVVIWLPPSASKSTVDSVLVEAGDWFPAAGSPILALSPTISSNTVRISDDSREQSSRFDDLTFTPTSGSNDLFSVQDWSIPLADAKQISSETETIGSVTADSAEASDLSVMAVPGFLMSLSSRERVTIPTMAIVEDENGMCVYIGGDPFTSHSLVPMGSSLSGVTYVESGFTGTEQVVLNPHEVGLTTC